MFDLTQPLDSNTPRFPGDPEVRIEEIHDVAPWQISALAMGTHSGTHMDAPRHCISGGKGIGAYGPERLVGRGIVLDARGFSENEALPLAILTAVCGATWPGWFALIRTGWDQYWGTESYFRHPYLSLELAEALAKANAGLVAIDTLSIDSTVDEGSDAHITLLGADTLVVENLRNLHLLDAHRPYTFAFLPLSLGCADGSPARVVAWDALEER